MAHTVDHYKKYQVYFFLYLAVICELLIVIVERDDAENELRREQRALEEKNRRIILELLKNMPAVSAAGDNQLKVNEERWFTIRVKGLGDKDTVNKPPTVSVLKDGVEVQTLTYGMEIRDSVMHGITGERIYRFNWRADKGAGRFEFLVNAGTNRVQLTSDLRSDAKVKVGSLDFTKEEIEKALKSDPETANNPVELYISRSENLDAARYFVEVISEAYDQLQIQADPIVTAVGYPTYNEIKVRGTTVDKISSINVLGGGSRLGPNEENNPYRNEDAAKGKWVWSGTFNEPGEKEVTLEAYDKRGAGQLSHSRPISFNVIVKNPYLVRQKPAGAFAGEAFEMNINVQGLEDVGSYRWNLELGGQKVESGSGSIVKYKLPPEALGKTLTLKATYRNIPYMVFLDSASKNLTNSEWMFNVGSPIDRMVSPSFSKKGEYPITQVFQFTAVRCGRCVAANYRNIPPNEVRLEVESTDGQDLLDYVEPFVRKDPNSGNELGTVLKFRLKGKVSKDGTDTTIRIRFGSFSDNYDITLFPE
jgi:hypothetical protein